VPCVRHVVLRCESGGTRIVGVVDCDYNNVVFVANEDLFDKMLGGVDGSRHVIAVRHGRRVFASFRGEVMLPRRVIVRMAGASRKDWEMLPPRPPTTD
jgi:hypothetical protein